VQTWTPAKEIQQPVLNTFINRMCHDGWEMWLRFISMKGISSPDQVEDCADN